VVNFIINLLNFIFTSICSIVVNYAVHIYTLLTNRIRRSISMCQAFGQRSFRAIIKLNFFILYMDADKGFAPSSTGHEPGMLLLH
jgi:hypothetical protein